jgi:hypothetical protein
LADGANLNLLTAAELRRLLRSGGVPQPELG